MDFKLYLITDRKLCDGRLVEKVEEALRAGVRAVQLREKDLTIKELTALAYKLLEVTRAYNAKLFVNDRVDVAMATGADGVHLTLSGLPIEATRKISAGKLIVGASTHSLEEAKAAQKAGADFIVFGPVYDTPSKRPYGEPLGINALTKVKDKLNIPVFAIGGIKPQNIKEIMESEADGIAVISGILSADSVYNETIKYLELL